MNFLNENGMNINRIISAIVLFIISSTAANALKWHDGLVKSLMADKTVDKNIVVERNPANIIIRANYNFTFPVRDIAKADYIRGILISHSEDALKFSMEGDRNSVLLLQAFEPPSYYNYKFWKNKDKYQLLISVSGNSRDKFVSSSSDKDFDKLFADLQNRNEATSISKDFERLEKSVEPIDKPVYVMAADNKKSDDNRLDKGSVFDGKVEFLKEESQCRLYKVYKIKYDSYGCPIDTLEALIGFTGEIKNPRELELLKTAKEQGLQSKSDNEKSESLYAQLSNRVANSNEDKIIVLNLKEIDSDKKAKQSRERITLSGIYTPLTQ